MAQTMLIISDDTEVLSLCQRIFTEEGFEVTATRNSLEGLGLVTRKQYTVILCDWHVPEPDGIGVVAALETQAAESAVVIICGYPSVDRATEAMKLGAMEYRPKPFTPDEISATVQKAIAGKLIREKKALGQFKKMLDKFPTQNLGDKGPKIIAETVAQTVGVPRPRLLGGLPAAFALA